MTQEEMDAKIAHFLSIKDWAGVANFIVNHGRSSLDLKILIRDALMKAAGVFDHA